MALQLSHLLAGLMRSACFGGALAGLAACTTTDKVTQTATWGGYSPCIPRHPDFIQRATNLQLPPVPRGCLTRVYAIPPKWIAGAPREKIDWADFLRSNGVIFPRGGFAIYFPPTSTLIVANTPDQLDLLEPM